MAVIESYAHLFPPFPVIRTLHPCACRYLKQELLSFRLRASICSAEHVRMISNRSAAGVFEPLPAQPPELFGGPARRSPGEGVCTAAQAAAERGHQAAAALGQGDGRHRRKRAGCHGVRGRALAAGVAGRQRHSCGHRPPLR